MLRALTIVFAGLLAFDPAIAGEEVTRVTGNSRFLFFCNSDVTKSEYFIIEQTELNEPGDGHFVDPRQPVPSILPEGTISLYNYSVEKASLKDVLENGELIHKSKGQLMHMSHETYDLYRKGDTFKVAFLYDRSKPDIPSVLWRSTAKGDEWDVTTSLDCNEKVLVSDYALDEMIESGNWVEPREHLLPEK